MAAEGLNAAFWKGEVMSHSQSRKHRRRASDVNSEFEDVVECKRCKVGEGLEEYAELETVEAMDVGKGFKQVRVLVPLPSALSSTRSIGIPAMPVRQRDSGEMARMDGAVRMDRMDGVVSLDSMREKREEVPSLAIVPWVPRPIPGPRVNADGVTDAVDNADDKMSDDAAGDARDKMAID